MLEAFAAGEVVLQGGRPFESPDLAQQCERSRFDLIHRVAAVGRAAGGVGIAQQQARLDEELYRIVADGFAGVGRVADAIGSGDEINDGCDAAQGSLGLGPGRIRL